MNPKNPILSIAYTIPTYPKTDLEEKTDKIKLTIPKPGNIKI